jgi:hypothetical protein
MQPQKNSYLLPFIDDVLNTIEGHDAYSLLDGYFGYHEIIITPKDKYKPTFAIDWGAFT